MLALGLVRASVLQVFFGNHIYGTQYPLKIKIGSGWGWIGFQYPWARSLIYVSPLNQISRDAARDVSRTVA